MKPNEISAIKLNIVRQAIREDWIIKYSSNEAINKTNELLEKRNVEEKYRQPLCFMIIDAIADYYSN